MRFLIIDTYYNAFLKAIYESYPDMAERPYQEQWQMLMAQCFGTADFYSKNLQRLGHEATELIVNCYPLQSQWANEHGMKLGYKLQKRMYRGLPLPWLGKDWWMPVLLEQIKSYRPDVVHFQDPCNTPAALLRAIRPYARLLTAQVASPVPSRTDLRAYDLMLTSFPHFVARFKQQGINSEYFRLGFEPKILESLAPVPKRGVVFIGGLSKAHQDRIHFLKQVAREISLEWWGYGENLLPPGSPLRDAYRGPAWGLDMYGILSSARIALNHHINVAENYANNMRLYEATGCGTLLVTDNKDNLSALFEPGREVVAYHSVGECIELAKYYQEREPERRTIAQAGQQRTLREHTYYDRMQEFIEMLQLTKRIT